MMVYIAIYFMIIHIVALIFISHHIMNKTTVHAFSLLCNLGKSQVVKLFKKNNYKNNETVEIAWRNITAQMSLSTPP